MAGRVRSADHIGISVSDMDRAVRFFRDGLDAEVSETVAIDDPRVAQVVGLPNVRSVVCQAALGGFRFELLQYLEPQGRQAQGHRPCDPGHMHLAFEVEDIEGMVERMRAHGFEPASAVQHGLGRGGLAACYCYGIDGLVVELIEQTPVA